MALGQNLRKARESRKLTASQVAIATHMKVQTVEAIEQEDFSGMPAAIYCKGFIKLYAEYMGMDPDPLTREYVERFLSPPPPVQPAEPEDKPGGFNRSFNKKEDVPAIAREPEDDESHNDLFTYGANRTEKPPEKLFEHAVEPEPAEDIAPTSISEGISGIATRVTEAISRFLSTVKDRSRQNSEATAGKEPEILQPSDNNARPSVDTSPITLPNRQILIISGGLACLILIIFLLSTVARFFRDGKNTGGQNPEDQELVLPANPPPPYID